MQITAQTVSRTMESAGSPERAAGMQRFFKTGPGEYAEGDKFLGISNPLCRQFVKQFSAISVPETEKLLSSPWHEVRLAALLLLVHQFRKGDRTLQNRIVEIYLSASSNRINNWDLVDLSAAEIIGMYDYLYRRKVIQSLADSQNLWQRRISIVATHTLIRQKDFALTLELVRNNLKHPHDLIHKACGWMLREVGKRDEKTLTLFLNEYRLQMPRTMLRYAIEHYKQPERKYFLSR